MILFKMIQDLSPKEINNLEKIIEYRESDFRIIPVVDENHKVINVINFRKIRSYLPIDAVINGWRKRTAFATIDRQCT